jgi:hypothetical protein
VLKLVRVEDRPDRLYEAVGDVERDHVDDPLLRVEHEGTGLAIHLVRLQRYPELHDLASEAGEDRADAIAAEDRPWERRHLAAAVAVHGDVRSEQLYQRIDVTVLEGREEARGEPLLFLPRGFEPRLLLIDPAARSRGELTAVLLALTNRDRDLVVAVGEDVMEQEDRALDRRQPFEQYEEGERERVCLLRVVRRVELGFFVVSQHGLGQPLSHVHLAASPRGTQVVDAEPGHDRREKGIRRFDLGPLAECALLAQECILDDVLCLADATEHAVREREELRPQLFEFFDGAHATFLDAAQ